MAAGDVTVDITSPNAMAGASFDGVDDDVSIANNNNFVFGNGDRFSIEAEIKTTKVVGNQTIMRYDSGGASRSLWLFRLTDDKLTVQFGNSDGTLQNTSSISSLVADTKYVVRVDVNPLLNKVDLLLNGVVDKNTTYDATSFRIDVDNPHIGSNNQITEFFSGVIGEIKFFLNDELKHYYPLRDDYNDNVGGANGSNSGSRLGIYEDDIAASIKAARTTANDVYLIAECADGRQAITTVIEEAP